MNTTENNKKLADFLNELTYNSDGQIKEDLKKLDFHYNWNSLMRVAEKIYSLDTYYDEYIDYNSSMFSSGRIELSTNIEAVYKACVEFVEWYNKEQLVGGEE